jgi:hypothetical protein
VGRIFRLAVRTIGGGHRQAPPLPRVPLLETSAIAQQTGDRPAFVRGVKRVARSLLVSMLRLPARIKPAQTA